MNEKAEHVRRAKPTRFHRCHWPGCKYTVAPAKWGCYKHWMKLPREIRTEIWRCYRVGQEEDKKPSAEYVTVAKRAREFAIDYQRRHK